MSGSLSVLILAGWVNATSDLSLIGRRFFALFAFRRRDGVLFQRRNQVFKRLRVWFWEKLFWSISRNLPETPSRLSGWTSLRKERSAVLSCLSGPLSPGRRMPGNGCDRCALNIVKNRFRSDGLATSYDESSSVDTKGWYYWRVVFGRGWSRL